MTNPLPGVPPVESPFFADFFAEGHTDPETLRVARDLQAKGYAVIDFPDPDIDELAAVIQRDLEGAYDWDAWREGRAAGLRATDAWQNNEAVRRIATNADVLALLERLYGRPAFPFQTLNFPVGTQQHFHSDSMHFSSMPERFMVGVWVALEDIHPDAGPLLYYPGSHRWPIYGNEHVGHTHRRTSETDQGVFEPMWQRLVASFGIAPERFFARKGQALIWAANLLHGGDAHVDKSRTRWSQVTHYYFEGCAYYTPMFSNLPAGYIFYREPWNILTNRQQENVYNGEAVPEEVIARANPMQRAVAPGLPEGFDSAAYLAANPDVAKAGVPAETHYLTYGFREGRRLRP